MDRVSELLTKITKDAQGISDILERNTGKITEMRAQLEGRIQDLRAQSDTNPKVQAIVASLEQLSSVVSGIEEASKKQSQIVRQLAAPVAPAAPGILSQVAQVIGGAHGLDLTGAIMMNDADKVAEIAKDVPVTMDDLVLAIRVASCKVVKILAMDMEGADTEIVYEALAKRRDPEMFFSAPRWLLKGVKKYNQGKMVSPEDAIQKFKAALDFSVSWDDIVRGIHSDLIDTPIDQDDNTVLHHAASMGHVDIFGMAAQAGANINAINLHGLTPLHLAVMGRHQNTVDEIISSGGILSLAIRDENNLRPLDYARDIGGLDVRPMARAFEMYDFALLDEPLEVFRRLDIHTPGEPFIVPRGYDKKQVNLAGMAAYEVALGQGSLNAARKLK